MNKKAIVRFLEKAFNEGLRLEDVRSKPVLYKYLRGIVREGYYPILYDHYIIIVSEGNDYGVTILNMPDRYYKLVQQLLGGKRYGKKYYYQSSEEAEDGKEPPITYPNRRKLRV